MPYLGQTVRYLVPLTVTRVPCWTVCGLGGGSGHPTLFPGPRSTNTGVGSRPQPAPVTGAPQARPHTCQPLPTTQPPEELSRCCCHQEVDRGAGGHWHAARSRRQTEAPLPPRTGPGRARGQQCSWLCWRPAQGPAGLPEPEASEAARGRAPCTRGSLSGAAHPLPLFRRGPLCPQGVLVAVGATSPAARSGA